MVWPLKNSRRQSLSSSSAESASRRQRSFFGARHKRRNTRMDANITNATESSLSSRSDTSNSAPWRVENIRSVPPRSDEWWTEESVSDSREGSDGEGFEAMVTSGSSSSSFDTRRFHNCGLETWLKVREEWTRRTVETLPPKPTPAEYNQLVRGLVKHIGERTYELPRKMALSDLIDVYNDIWDGYGH